MNEGAENEVIHASTWQIRSGPWSPYNRIITITAAPPGMVAVYRKPDGDQERIPILCLALLELWDETKSESGEAVLSRHEEIVALNALSALSKPRDASDYTDFQYYEFGGVRLKV